MKKNLKFYIVLYLAKLARIALKVIGRDATYFPGKLAVTLCPDFLGRIDKPKIIIANKVTVTREELQTLASKYPNMTVKQLIELMNSKCNWR